MRQAECVSGNIFGSKVVTERGRAVEPIVLVRLMSRVAATS